MNNTLKDLCSLYGGSGREENVREYIIEQIKDFARYSVDPLGNIIAFKKGANTPENKVMLAAHMDEVGFIVNYITEKGFLKFTSVGGVDPAVICGKPVFVGSSRIAGAVGMKPVHLLKSDEKDKLPGIDEMYIDIGANDADEAKQLVSLGDRVYFESGFYKFGNGFIKARALDDRAGCAVLIDLIKSEPSYDLWFAFTVQEEVGLRGAKTAAYSIAPDYAIVVEATTAADISGVTGEKRVCELGKGAVVSYMDNGTVYNMDLYNRAFELAQKNNIKVQPKTQVAGGNDAGAIHTSRGGVKTLSISLPCRYLHSPSCVIKEEDLKDVRQLTQLTAESFAND